MLWKRTSKLAAGTLHILKKISGEHELTKNMKKNFILQTDSYKYLGFVISWTGHNTVNMRKMKNKSFSIIRKALNKFKTILSLKQLLFWMSYYIIEGNFPTYDMYYAMKQNEFMQLERIEEEFLGKIVITTKECSIPAQFKINKMRLLYFKYI